MHAPIFPFVQSLSPAICREWAGSSLGSVELQLLSEAAPMTMLRVSGLPFALVLSLIFLPVININ